ncbi:MAG TPA: carboxypeptidase-like regulatory domain-containing protein [Longimicrobium sp.]|nr:carboxypeptidase-like regulatory domain-containing protein [Longimicrobium sp.]
MSQLEGTVIDAVSHHPLAGVAVTATSPVLGAPGTVGTDAQGSYTIPGLPPGTCTLQFEKDGYRPCTRGGIPLRAIPVRVDVELLPTPAG